MAKREAQAMMATLGMVAAPSALDSPREQDEDDAPRRGQALGTTEEGKELQKLRAALSERTAELGRARNELAGESCDALTHARETSNPAS